MKLYHYTSFENLNQILDDDEIKLTRSNLVEPRNPRIDNGNVVFETDSIEPVVWLTSLLDFGQLRELGLRIDTVAAIEIEVRDLDVCLWDEWAEENHIKREWFNKLKRKTPQWRSFYVSERPIRYLSDKIKLIAWKPGTEKEEVEFYKARRQARQDLER